MSTSSTCELFGGPAHGKYMSVVDDLGTLKVPMQKVPQASLVLMDDEPYEPAYEIAHYTRVGRTNQFEYVGRGR